MFILALALATALALPSGLSAVSLGPISPRASILYRADAQTQLFRHFPIRLPGRDHR